MIEKAIYLANDLHNLKLQNIIFSKALHSL